jgi:putative ABC transport system permease protein
MNRLVFNVRYALRSLLRDGVRSFLAMLSVAFGVLSLVTMQLLASVFLNGPLLDQRLSLGGDAQFQTASRAESFTPDALAQIDTWQQTGVIGAYSPLALGSAALMRSTDSGRSTVIVEALGIDPATYPLVGTLELREPVGATLTALLSESGTALITRDIADARSLQIGSMITVLGNGSPVQLRITGIVDATPSQIGYTLLYSFATARLLENREDVINAVSITWGTDPAAQEILTAAPYPLTIARDRASQIEASSVARLFDAMLKAAGVLGLLIGGISVSNTLQVILARRKLEIAMLKTLGLKQGDLLILMSIETGIIGLAGGVLGALLGSIVTGALLEVLSGSATLLLRWSPDPLIVTGGILIGVVTAVVFGMQAILAISSTRPVEVLRELPPKQPLETSGARLLLYVLLFVVFGVLVGWIIGSVVEGVLYVIAGGWVLIALRGVFWAVLWLALQMPLPPLPMLQLARAHLRRRKMQASLSVIALFAGAFSVTFAALVIRNAQTELAARQGAETGYNLLVYAHTEDTATAQAQMALAGGRDVYISTRVQGEVNDNPLSIEGRSADALDTDVRYDGAWSDDGQIGVLPQTYRDVYAIGDMLRLRYGERTMAVELVGFYDASFDSIASYENVLIVPAATLRLLAGDAVQTRVIGMFPPDALDAATDLIGSALPEVLVLSRADRNNALTAGYRALFTFAVSVAGLAFVAGAVLIANSAGLTVVERRREIGVFKAVGYTSGHVLRLLLAEYGFLGLIAGIFGIAGSVAAVHYVNATQPSSALAIEPAILIGMLIFSASIALVSAAAVAWQPAHVRPLDVLRYE